MLGLWRLRRIGRVPDRLWICLAILGAFWILAGLNQIPGRDPTASRYQYVGVILVMLVAAEMLRGVRIGRGTLATVFVVAAAAIGADVYYLHQAYGSYRFTSQLEKADLGALEIARGTVEPGFALDEDLADTAYVHVEAGPYFSARDEFGSPAYSPAELAAARPQARYAADKVLFGALRLGIVLVPTSQFPKTEPGVAKTGACRLLEVPPGACVSVPPGDGGPPLLALPREGAQFQAGAAPIEDVKLTRFATGEFPVDFEQRLEPGEAGELRIPPDRSAVPWKLEIDSGAAVTVCGLPS